MRVALLVLAVVAFHPADAEACTCDPAVYERTDAEHIAAVDVVVSGRIVDVSTAPAIVNDACDPQGRDEFIAVTLAVDAVFKGCATFEQVVYGAAGCETTYTIGDDVVVYATISPHGSLHSSMCTAPGAPSDAEVLDDVAGPADDASDVCADQCQFVDGGVVPPPPPSDAGAVTDDVDDAGVSDDADDAGDAGAPLGGDVALSCSHNAAPHSCSPLWAFGVLTAFRKRRRAGRR